MTTYANPTALIETDQLVARLGDSSLAIVEVDEDTSAYAEGHIPGAVALDWQHELHALPRRDFISAEALAELLGARGISAENTIVLYGGNNNWFAAYAYWLFRLRGVENVRLLNGGRKKWELEGRSVDAEKPDRAPTSYRLGRAATRAADVPRRDDPDGAAWGRDGRRTVTRGVHRRTAGPGPPAAGAAARGRTHPGCPQHPVGQGRQR